VLARYLGVDPADVPLEVAPSGKPYIGRAADGLQFSASSADGTVVVAVAAEVAAEEAGRLGELAVTRVRRRFPEVEARYELAEGTAVPVLADASHGCGLVVVGNRGRGPVGALLSGSVGDGLIARTHSPLAVVH